MSRINYPEKWAPESRKALDDLFEKARGADLLFYVNNLTGEHWFTPDELQAVQENGGFVWAAGNWHLRSKQERVMDCNRKVIEARRVLEAATTDLMKAEAALR